MRLFEYWASLVIEKRHRDIVKSLADKIELAFKGNSIMVRREGAVRRVGLAVLYRPVGDKPGDGALSSLGLVVNVPITVSLERNGTERTDEEKAARSTRWNFWLDSYFERTLSRSIV